MAVHHKQISFNFLVRMTAQAIQHHFWVAKPQRINFFLFWCYCHGNWLNYRSRLHLYCSLIFILICFRCQEEKKSKSTVFLETVTPCALRPLLPECSHLCFVFQGKRLETWRFVSSSLMFCDSIAQPSWRGQLSRWFPHLFLTSVHSGAQIWEMLCRCIKTVENSYNIMTDIIRSQGELLLKVPRMVKGVCENLDNKYLLKNISIHVCMWWPKP